MAGIVCGVRVMLICFILTGTLALQWGAPFKEGQLVYSCVGNKGVFPWEYQLLPGETIVFIRWTFHGDFSTEVVATYTPDMFLAAPGYLNRVAMVGTAGISLDDVTTADNGNYSVAISGLDASGEYVTFQGMAVLQATDSLLVRGGKVKLTQRAEAVRNNNEWSVALACGQFTHLHTPPFPVYWTTPSGAVLKESDDFQDGSYILLLPNPVKGGNYSCEIPQLFRQEACLSAGTDETVKDTIIVDEVKARLSLLEAQQAALLEENEELRAKLVSQTDGLVQKGEETGRGIARLSARVDVLEAVSTNSTLILQQHEDLLSAYQDRSSPIVFTAFIPEDRYSPIVFSAFIPEGNAIPASKGSVIPFTSVLTNQGNAYHGSTATFTAPVDGNYFFVVDINISKDYDHVSIYKDGALTVHADRDDTSSTHLSTNAVLTLQAGDVIQVKQDSTRGAVDPGRESVFSGFLVR